MKKNKKHILFVCSWLNHKIKIGSFFIEQGNLFRKDYHISMVKFQPFGINEVLKYRNLVKIQIHESNKEIPNIYYVYFLGSKIFRNFFKNKAIKKFYSLLRKSQGKVDLIHTQSLFDGYEYTLYLHEYFGIKYIHTEHNQLSFLTRPKSIKNKIEIYLNNSLNNLAVSNDKIRQFYTNGLYYKFENVGNLINSNFSYEASARRDYQSDFRIITIGDFNPVKNQKTLLKSLKLLEKKIGKNKVSFLWVGFNLWGVENTIRVQEIIKSFGFNKIKIDLIPLASREETKNYLINSDVFVLSSIVEGMPVSVLEALACGVPVLSTNCGGVDEVINEFNGKVFNLFDYQGIGEFLIEMYEGRRSFDRLLISKDVLSKFGEKAFYKRLNAIYEKALSKF